MQEKIYKWEDIANFKELKKLLEEWYNSFNCEISLYKQWLIYEDFKSIAQYKYTVNWDFNCNFNKLTSLIWCPQKVWWKFSCVNNKLVLLKWCPLEIWWDFDCSQNKLTSLKSSPKKIWWSFKCYENKLTSFLGWPKEINGSINCSDNQITTTDWLPKWIKNYISITSNQITSINWVNEFNGINIYVQNNPLERLIKLNKNFYKIWKDIYYWKTSIDLSILLNPEDKISEQPTLEYINTYRNFIENTINVSNNGNIPDIIKIKWKKFSKKLLKI